MTPPTTTREMLASLQSTTCPSCGKPKRPQQSFCTHDYHELTGQMKSDLYKRFGSGYERAFEVAIAHLAAKREERIEKRGNVPGLFP